MELPAVLSELEHLELREKDVLEVPQLPAD